MGALVTSAFDKVASGIYLLTYCGIRRTTRRTPMMRSRPPQVVNGSTLSNYCLVTSTELREFGITARIALGSR